MSAIDDRLVVGPVEALQASYIYRLCSCFGVAAIGGAAVGTFSGSGSGRVGIPRDK